MLDVTFPVQQLHTDLYYCSGKKIINETLCATNYADDVS